MIISTSKKLKTIAFDRDSNILIAFNNYNAVESVPGVKKLELEIEEKFNQSKKRKERPSPSSRYDDPYFDEYGICQIERNASFTCFVFGNFHSESFAKGSERG